MIREIETTRASSILFFLFCATNIFTTLAYGTVHQPTLAIFYIIAATVLILWAIDAFTSGTLRFNRTALQIPLAAAVLYAVIQIIPFGTLAETAGVSDIPRTISLEPFATRNTAVYFLGLLIFFAAMLAFVDSAKRIRTLAATITVFGFAFAFFAILQAVLSPSKIYGVYDVPYAQPFGSFVNRHNFAAYMEMTFCLPLGLMFTGAVGKDRRLLYITAIALMGIALILSGSRGGLIALLAGIFFLIILTTKTKNYNQFILKIGLGVLLVATIVVGSILIGGESSLSRLAETAASDDFSSNRTHIWSVALSVMRHNFPLGAGFGAFGMAYTPFDTLNGVGRVEQAHNDYLEVLATAGIIGLILGGFFLFKFFRIGFQNSNVPNQFRRGIAVGAFAGCFAVLVHSLFDFVLHTTAVALLFLTLVSLVVASGNKLPDDEPDAQPRENKKRRAASITPIEKGRRRTKPE